MHGSRHVSGDIKGWGRYMIVLPLDEDYQVLVSKQQPSVLKNTPIPSLHLYTDAITYAVRLLTGDFNDAVHLAVELAANNNIMIQEKGDLFQIIDWLGSLGIELSRLYQLYDGRPCKRMEVERVIGDNAVYLSIYQEI